MSLENGILMISDENSSIPPYAYINKNEIKTLFITDGVSSIGEFAFSGCYNMEQIVIPESISRIDTCAFSGCTSLTSVVLSERVSFLGDGAFSSCHGLEKIDVSSKNPFFKSIDGVLFSKDETILYQYPAGKPDTEYKIPSTVTTIHGQAFAGAQYLEKLDIPETVTRIGPVAFSYCKCLKLLVLPSGLDKITDYLFSGSAIEHIDIPSSVTSIGDGAFSTARISMIVIPNSVTHIGKFAFSGCMDLSYVFIPSSVTRLDTQAFNQLTQSNVDLLIECEAKSTPSGWSFDAFHPSATIKWGVSEPTFGEEEDTDEDDEYSSYPSYSRYDGNDTVHDYIERRRIELQEKLNNLSKTLNSMTEQYEDTDEDEYEDDYEDEYENEYVNDYEDTPPLEPAPKKDNKQEKGKTTYTLMMVGFIVTIAVALFGVYQTFLWWFIDSAWAYVSGFQELIVDLLALAKIFMICVLFSAIREMVTDAKSSMKAGSSIANVGFFWGLISATIAVNIAFSVIVMFDFGW